MTGDSDPNEVPPGEEERVLLAHTNAEFDSSESDDDFPPPPPGYYRRGEQLRHTNFCRLLLVLLAVVFACVLVAELIGQSSSREDPGHMVLAAMDRSADPCKDFYEYACGSWLRKEKIPPDRTAYSRSFSKVYDRLRLQIRTLLEKDLQKSENPHAIAGRFYASCMEESASGPTNLRQIVRFRDSFDNIKDSESLAAALATLHISFSSGMFDAGVGIDEKHPTKHALYVSQGGLGLSHRDKYTSEKEADVQLRKAYIRLIEDHLRVAGRAKLIQRRGYAELAERVFSFEKSLASISRPPEELRKPEENYNLVRISKLPSAFAFDKYLKVAKINVEALNDTIIVDNVEYIAEVAAMMSRVTNDVGWRNTVKGYLAFHLLRHMSTHGIMGADLYIKNFHFKQLVYGVKKMPEKWKRCQSMTSTYVGDALGAAFVEKHFSEHRKQVAKKLAMQITRSFRLSLGKLDWMDAETRTAAMKKLDAINWKVGYTSKFDTYPGLRITKRGFDNNVVAAMQYGFQYNINKLGKPIDKTEWSMHPYEVNAYYSSTRNEMVFPAGILQTPFFSDKFPDAMNYGSIGMIIGHEMSHGFDDQGRKYDENGRLTTWWSKESAKRYDKRSKCFVNLFDSYKPRQTTMHVKGNLTLGENLADTNGVKVAFHAFKKMGNNSDENARAPNAVLSKELTNHQLFFVAFAQTWCTRYRPKALQLQMMTDPHSPGKFRVLGSLSENPDFAHTFKCKPATPYNPVNRCSLW